MISERHVENGARAAVTVDPQPTRAPEGWELTLAGGHTLRVQGALGDDALRTVLALLAHASEAR